MTRTGGFQDDDFWTGFHDFLFSEQRHAHAAELLDTSPLLSFSPGSRVLDLCCGPGVFTVPLALRGHRVTGVDLSPAMLDRARKRTADAGAQVTYVRSDARVYEAPDSFDAVLNLFTSFGYFEDPADNARVMRTMYRCLASGRHARAGPRGQGAAGPEGDPAEGGAARRRPAGADRHRAGRLGPAAQRLGPGPGRPGDARATLVWFVYSAVELRRMAQDAGFGRVEVFGGFDGRPYDGNAERLILRAVRGH